MEGSGMNDSEKILSELVLQVSTLTSEVVQLRSLVSGSPNFVEGWAVGKDAAAALKNEGVKNAKHLQRLRLDGAFSEGRGEIRNVSRGDRPTWEYHVPNCRKALQRHFKKSRGIG
jgi:hypothetical protein